jgi:hypothetical protein
VQAARGIPELLATPGHYRELRYEDLRHSPRDGLGQLLDWLELPTDARLIDEMVARNELETIRRNKKFDAISRPSTQGANAGASEPEVFFGKAAVGHHSFGLTRLQEYQCYRICGRLLEELGYCVPCPPVPWWARLACSWKLRSLLGLGPV